MTVSRQDVIGCYRYILGREPESEQAIVGHMNRWKNLLECHIAFYKSSEYKKRQET